MKLNFLVIFGVICGLLLALTWPQKAAASWPKLKIEYTARNLTTGSSWGESLDAKAGDKLELKAVLSNTEPGSTIQDVKIMVPLSDERLVLHQRFHLRAMNSGSLDTEVTVSVPSGYMILEYLPGTSKLTAGGSTRAISPDTDSTNITTQEIAIGNIPYGEGNAVTITYQAQVEERKKEASGSGSKAAAEGAIGGSGTASASAVTKSNPEAGIGDWISWPSLKWLMVGFLGVGLKIWGARIRERLLV
jgi:hypothetical protein